MIRDYAAAGVVRSTAKVLEWIEASGIHTTGYDEEVPSDLWKRIVNEGVDESIWAAGTARLNARELTDEHPHVTLTGIRFAAIDIHKIGWSHRGYVTRKGDHAAAADPTSASEQVLEEASAPVGARKPRRADPAAIPPGAIICTIERAGTALGYDRTTINKLMKNGKLERVDDAAGVRITVASLMALARSDPRT